MNVEALLARVLEELRSLGARLNSRSELPSVLTLKMAARELSRSVSTVKLLIRRGELSTVMVGGRRMVPRSEIERIARQSDEATQEVEAPTAVSLKHRRPAAQAKAESEKILARLQAEKKRR